MAKTTGGLLAKQQEQPQKTVNPTVSALSNMLSSDSVKERFQNMLGKKSAGFLSSVMTLVNQTPLLQRATPQSIMAAAATAASLDLPILNSLGRAYIIPYGSTATFILGTKGLVELAIRSQQYRRINVVTVYEGELESWDKFTEEYKLGEKISNKVIGFMASFELINGFKKTLYWTEEEVRSHAKRFSKTYSSPNSVWASDFEKMAEKSVLAALLKHWGPLSVEMQRALDGDADINPEYNMKSANETVSATMDIEAETVQTEDGQTVDVETGEIIFSADDVEEAVQG